MRKFLLVLGVSVFLCMSAWATGFAPKGGGTECATSPCNLNANTTLNSQGICLADGTSCPAGITDTNAATICTGTTTYLDGEGNCDDLSGVYLTAVTGAGNISSTGGTTPEISITDTPTFSTLTVSGERWDFDTYGHYIDGNDNANAIVVSGLEVDNNVFIDKSIYFTSTTASALFMKQSDGGCSKCGVDAAGTTFSCIDVTCPTGM